MFLIGVALIAFVAGGVLPGVRAQIQPERVGHVGTAAVVRSSVSGPRATGTQKGLTARLLRVPAYENISRKIERLRFRLRKQDAAGSVEVGDRRSFFVRDVQNLSQWNVVEAELLARASGVQFWMEVTERQALRQRGLLRPVLDSLRRVAVRRTPDGSVEPRHGILPIEREYFGSPPNVDGDGMTDVLLLDIEDHYEQTGGYVAGFFDPNDLTTNAHSNRRDLLYIDTRPTIVRGNTEQNLHVEQAGATIAHEYQHLIHARYEGERRERTFVNEGLSEFAEILCGFPPRPADAYFEAPGRPLMSWNYEAPLPDYARASLFAHYFFEQIGREWVDDLVKNQQVGLEGLRTVLRQAGGPIFPTLFRNWGRALLMSDRSVDPAYGYRHPERRNVRFETADAFEGLPGNITLRAGALSHVPLRIPLVDYVSIQAHSSAHLEYDVRINYPGAADRIEPGVEAGQRIDAARAPHGSVQLLASTLSVEPDSERIEAQVLARGHRSGHRTTLHYGDGTPDPYSGTASYLLLDEPGEATAVTFGPQKQKTWLRAVSVDVVFLSELAGSDVPGGAPRRVTVQVRSLDGGHPGAPLTPPLTRTVDRTFGNLKLEPVSLLRQYDALSALRDSFVAVLTSGDPSNPLAVGLDRVTGGEPAGSAFHRRKDGASWTPIRDVRAEGARLSGYRPLIHARTATPETQTSGSALHLDAARDFDRGYVRLQAPFPIDSTETEVLARLPSGTIVKGQWTPSDSTDLPLQARSRAEVVFQFPTETGDDYHLYARAASENHVVARTTKEWRIPEERAVRIESAYPNPTVDDARLSITLLDPSQVTVRLYDVLGRVVKRKRAQTLAPGTHEIDISLRALSSGTYLARVETRRLWDGHVNADARKIIRVR